MPQGPIHRKNGVRQYGWRKVWPKVGVCPPPLDRTTDCHTCMRTIRKPVIVVDDDASMSQAIERLLGAAGLPVVTFSSAEALLESELAEAAGCFVFDLLLTGISGFDLYRQLLELGIQRPVIFISAQDEPGHRESARSLGAVVFLPKPFPGRDFLRAVKQASEATRLE
jgi:FixJ family two-component response regulator